MARAAFYMVRERFKGDAQAWDLTIDSIAKELERRGCPKHVLTLRAMLYGTPDASRWEGVGGYYNQKGDELRFCSAFLSMIDGLPPDVRRRIEGARESAAYVGD